MIRLLWLISFIATGFPLYVSAEESDTVTIQASIVTVTPQETITTDEYGRCFINYVHVDCDTHMPIFNENVNLDKRSP